MKAKVKPDKNKVRAQADKYKKLDDMNGLARSIAEARIRFDGYYAYTEAETGLKVFVENLEEICTNQSE